MLALASRWSQSSRTHLARGHASAVTFTSSGPDAARSLVALLEAHSAERIALTSVSSSSSPVEPTATVFALSHDTPDLSGVLSVVRRLHPQAIGCLSSPPTAGTSSLALAHFFNDANERFALFRSREAGRASISVGHWRPLHELAADAAGESSAGASVDEDRLRKAFEGGDWSSMWGDEAMVKSEGTSPAKLEGIEAEDASAVDALVVLTTPASATPFVQQAAALFPQAPATAGLLAPPTPFATGLAHTLFWRKGEQVENGAIGVARFAPRSTETEAPGQKLWSVRSGWAGLEPVKQGEVLVVNSCQGNLLLSIEAGHDVNPNPTRQLLSLLSTAHLPPLGKDKDFYLGFLAEGAQATFAGTNGFRRVVKIMSGDPSRGGMALDCEDSLEKGDRVAFLHRPDGATSADEFNSHLDDSRTLLAFSNPPPPVGSPPITEGHRAEHGVFRALSESGVLVGRTVERVAGSWAVIDQSRSR